MFNVPGVVLALALTMTAVHAFTVWGPVDSEQIMVLFAFLPARGFLDSTLAPFPAWALEGAEWWTYVTYGLLHADWMHLALNVLFMLAFGSFVARRLGPLRFLLLSAAGAAAGAAAYLALHAGEIAVLIGASAAVSAQVAGAARLMFARAGALRHMREREIRNVRTLSLRETFRHRPALTFILAWLGINVIFGVTGIGTQGQGQVAWEAHLGGFAVGLLLFGVFDRRSTPADV
ncbi:MAG: rhomboid family intramembrane serine protease [Pseudomonadota bacterium]|nr:rhomboid family intramembrane serine protease [Pseudomonadota bacterium]